MKGRPLVQDNLCIKKNGNYNWLQCGFPTYSKPPESDSWRAPASVCFVQSSSRILVLSEGCTAPSTAFWVSGNPDCSQCPSCWLLLPGKSHLQQTYNCPSFVSFQLWGGPATMWQASSRGKTPVFNLTKTKTAKQRGQLPGCSFYPQFWQWQQGVSASIFSSHIIDPRHSSLGFLQKPQSNYLLILTLHQNHLVNFTKQGWLGSGPWPRDSDAMA